MSPYIVLDFHGTVHGEFVDEAEALNLREALTAEGTEVWVEQAEAVDPNIAPGCCGQCGPAGCGDIAPYGDVPALPPALSNADPGDENDYGRRVCGLQGLVCFACQEGRICPC